MGYRKFTFVPDEYYHIYNRGNSKQTIFLDEGDYSRFLKLLFVSNSVKSFKLHFLKDDSFDPGEKLVAIGAYCLMPNHFHILLTPLVEGGVSKFMQKLTTGYSMFFNSKYERTGALFEGKFKAELAQDDRYLKYLFSYIHLNPVKLIDPSWKEKGISNVEVSRRFIEEYSYSSLPNYLGLMNSRKGIIDREKFPNYFPTHGNAAEELFSWFEYRHEFNRKDLLSPVKAVLQ